jgi:hypothetical protein
MTDGETAEWCFAQQLVQAFQLAFIVAQDQRRHLATERGAEPFEVAIDPLGREESRHDLHRFVAQHQAGEAVQPGPPLLGRLKDRLTARHLFAQPAGHLQMVGRLAPRPGHLLGIGTGRFLDQERVTGGSSGVKACEDLSRRSRRFIRPGDLGPDR